MLYFVSLFLSSALSVCVTIIQNLHILRISFKQKQNTEHNASNEFPKISFNNKAGINISD